MVKTRKEYCDRFYEVHPELKTKKFKCADCGHEYSYFNKSKHMKTKIHLLVVEKLREILNDPNNLEREQNTQ